MMKAMRYKQSQGDHTLFIKYSASGGVTTLIFYVNDIVVTGNDKAKIDILKECLIREFEIKGLGRLEYFLGLEVAHSRHGIFISQHKYVLDLLSETGKLGCKPVETPIEQNHRLSEYVEDATMDRESYQKLVGKLIYLSHTRPDIAYAVGVVSHFSWRSKKQNVVARSSAEAEFQAMALGICKLLWMKIILDDLKIKCNGPMKLYCDNKSAINIAHNPVQHDRTKHVEVDRSLHKGKVG